jgi:hypothetical protein
MQKINIYKAKISLISLFILSISTTSCMLHTEKELIDKNVKETACINKPFENSLEVLKKNLAKCYTKDININYVTNSPFRPSEYDGHSSKQSQSINERKNPDGSYDFVYRMSCGKDCDSYLMSINIRNESEACPTRFTAYIYNSNWKKHYDRMKGWMEGTNNECQFW